MFPCDRTCIINSNKGVIRMHKLSYHFRINNVTNMQFWDSVDYNDPTFSHGCCNIFIDNSIITVDGKLKMSIILLLPTDKNYTISSSWLIVSGNMLIRLWELVLEFVNLYTLCGQIIPRLGDNYNKYCVDLDTCCILTIFDKICLQKMKIIFGSCCVICEKIKYNFRLQIYMCLVFIFMYY